MPKARIVVNDRMSNRQYHAAGKPNWWIRIGEGNFADCPQTRGDQKLNVVVELPEGTKKVFVGCGPKGTHGIRCTITPQWVEAENETPP